VDVGSETLRGQDRTSIQVSADPWLVYPVCHLSAEEKSFSWSGQQVLGGQKDSKGSYESYNPSPTEKGREPGDLGVLSTESHRL
jgi:hypothetical protein